MDENYKLELFLSDNGDCPYLEKKNWQNGAFPASRYPRLNNDGTVPAGDYEVLLEQGFRRSGTIFYKNYCPGCNECLPIRISAEGFTPTKSQRRSIRKNEDLSITCVPARFNREHYELYCHYQDWKHESDDISEEGYANFLCSAPVPAMIMEFRTADGTLAGCSYLDILPNGLSSVYFTFSEEAKKRSLGVFSVLCEIEECRKRGLDWLYMGFYVKDSKKMNYKTDYKPYQLAPEGHWQ